MMRAMRSIPSSACVRSVLEILTCLAVNSTSMVSLRSRYLGSNWDVPREVGFYSIWLGAVRFRRSHCYMGFLTRNTFMRIEVSQPGAGHQFSRRGVAAGVLKEYSCPRDTLLLYVAS